MLQSHTWQLLRTVCAILSSIVRNWANRVSAIMFTYTTPPRHSNYNIMHACKTKLIHALTVLNIRKCIHRCAMKVILVCVLISAIQNYWISRPNMARTLIVTPTHTRGSWKSRRTEIKVVILSNFNFIARDWWKVDKIYIFRLSKPLGLKYHFENLQFAEQCFWELNAIYKWGCNPGHVWCGFHIWSKTYKTTCDTIGNWAKPCAIVSFGALVSTLAHNPLPRQHKNVAHISHLQWCCLGNNRLHNALLGVVL